MSSSDIREQPNGYDPHVTSLNGYRQYLKPLGSLAHFA